MDRRRISFFLLLMLFLTGLFLTSGCATTADGIVESPAEEEEKISPAGKTSDEEEPTIGIALSGGGGLGIAHIGVIGVLVENEIPIDLITGTSAGAIVGALYADGITPAEMEEIVSEISWADFLVASVPELGFFSTEGMVKKLEENLRSETFEDLAIPLGVIATSLDDGKEVVIDSGNLARGVAASGAIPVIFQPVEYGDMLLVDGGLVNNLPADLARKMGADIVIAVNLADNFRFEGRPDGLIETGIRSYNILQRSHSVAVDADIEIHPDLDGVAGTDLNQYREIIARGREAAEKVLPEILSLLEKKKGGQD